MTPPALGPAPRLLPLSVWVRARFGGTLTQVGWALIALGMLSGIVLVGRSEFVTALTFVGETRRTSGVVLAVRETRESTRSTPIDAVRYRYSVGDTEHEGESYGDPGQHTFGQTVAVEYLARSPDSSRIVGLRKRSFEMVSSFVLLFALVGGVIVGVGLARNRHRVQLLRNGELALATLVGLSATGATMGDEPVLRLRFRFEVPRPSGAGDYRAAAASLESYEVELLTERSDDFADPQPVLYDPSNPAHALVLNGLPSIVVAPDGRLQALPGAALLLVTPAASLVGLVATVLVAAG
jgi:hypothetical protein